MRAGISEKGFKVEAGRGKLLVADGEELPDAVTGTDGGKFAVGGLQGAADLSLRGQSHHCRPRQIFHLHPLLQFANGVDVGLQGLVVSLVERKAFGRWLQPMKPLAQLGEVGLVGGEGLERLLRVVIGRGVQDVTATGNALHRFHQLTQSGDGKPDVFRLFFPLHRSCSK